MSFSIVLIIDANCCEGGVGSVKGRHQNLTEIRYLYSVKIEGEGVLRFCRVKI